MKTPATGVPAARITTFYPRGAAPAAAWHECPVCGACYDDPADAAACCTRGKGVAS
jgi:hypothetical protein